MLGLYPRCAFLVQLMMMMMMMQLFWLYHCDEIPKTPTEAIRYLSIKAGCELPIKCEEDSFSSNGEHTIGECCYDCSGCTDTMCSNHWQCCPESFGETRTRRSGSDHSEDYYGSYDDNIWDYDEYYNDGNGSEYYNDGSGSDYSEYYNDYSGGDYSGNYNYGSGGDYSGNYNYGSGGDYSGNYNYGSGGDYSGNYNDGSGGDYSGNYNDGSGGDYSGNYNYGSGGDYSGNYNDGSGGDYSGNYNYGSGGDYSGNYNYGSGGDYSGDYNYGSGGDYSGNYNYGSGGDYSGDYNYGSGGDYSGDYNYGSGGDYSGNYNYGSGGDYSGNYNDGSGGDYSGNYNDGSGGDYSGNYNYGSGGDYSGNYNDGSGGDYSGNYNYGSGGDYSGDYNYGSGGDYSGDYNYGSGGDYSGNYNYGSGGDYSGNYNDGSGGDYSGNYNDGSGGDYSGNYNDGSGGDYSGNYNDGSGGDYSGNYNDGSGGDYSGNYNDGSGGDYSGNYNDGSGGDYSGNYNDGSGGDYSGNYNDGSGGDYSGYYNDGSGGDYSGNYNDGSGGDYSGDLWGGANREDGDDDDFSHSGDYGNYNNVIQKSTQCTKLFTKINIGTDPESPFYKMVTTCPNTDSDTEVPRETMELCTSNIYENIMNLIPVLGYDNNMYRNKHCLQCNYGMNFLGKPLNLALSRRSQYYYDPFKSLKVDLKSDFSALDITSIQTSDILILSATPHFTGTKPYNRLCPPTQTYDMWDCNNPKISYAYSVACKQFNSGIRVRDMTTNLTYVAKNIACAYCALGDKMAIADVPSNGMKRCLLENQAEPWLLMNPLLLNDEIDTTNGLLFVSQMESNIDTGSCELGHFHDKVSATCRKILCPRHHFIYQGKCHPTFTHSVGQSYYIKVRVPVQQDEDAFYTQFGPAVVDAILQNSILVPCDLKGTMKYDANNNVEAVILEIFFSGPDGTLYQDVLDSIKPIFLPDHFNFTFNGLGYRVYPADDVVFSTEEPGRLMNHNYIDLSHLRAKPNPEWRFNQTQSCQKPIALTGMDVCFRIYLPTTAMINDQLKTLHEDYKEQIDADTVAVCIDKYDKNAEFKYVEYTPNNDTLNDDRPEDDQNNLNEDDNSGGQNKSVDRKNSSDDWDYSNGGVHTSYNYIYITIMWLLISSLVLLYI